MLEELVKDFAEHLISDKKCGEVVMDNVTTEDGSIPHRVAMSSHQTKKGVLQAMVKVKL